MAPGHTSAHTSFQHKVNFHSEVVLCQMRPKLEVRVMETMLVLDKFRSGCHPSRKPGFYYCSLHAAHKSPILRTMCPFVPEVGVECCVKFTSLAPEATELKPLMVSQGCAPASRQPGQLSMSGICPVSGDSSRQTHRGDTNTPSCATGQSSYCASPSPGLPALHQPQLCSPSKNKSLGRLSMALGFQQHKGYPRGISRDP